MKNTLAVVGLVAFFCTSYAMKPEGSLLLELKPKHTLAGISKEIDTRLIEIHSPQFGYPQRFEEEIKDLEIQYKELIKQKESSDVQWPVDHKEYRLITANLSNQNLATLQTLESDTIVSILHRAPAHVECSLLTRINVSHNKLQDLPLMYMTDICPNLQEVDASYNNIRHVSLFKRVDGDYPYVSYRSLNGALKILNLSHNQLSSFDLGSLFNRYPMEFVDLSNNSLKEVTWSKGYFLSDTYPSIDVRNTDLSQEQKETLRKEYLYRVQSKTSLLTNAMTFFTGCLASTVVGASLAGANIPISGIGYLGAVVGSGLGSSVLGRLWAYACAFSKLSTIEKEVQDRIIFEDGDIKEELEV